MWLFFSLSISPTTSKVVELGLSGWQPPLNTYFLASVERPQESPGIDWRSSSSRSQGVPVLIKFADPRSAEAKKTYLPDSDLCVLWLFFFFLVFAVSFLTEGKLKL